LVYLILPPGPSEGSLKDFMPKLDGILETAIHPEDVVRARAFYEGVLGWSRSIATTDCPSSALKIFGKTKT